jgi:hypothetical protein
MPSVNTVPENAKYPEKFVWTGTGGEDAQASVLQV